MGTSTCACQKINGEPLLTTAFLAAFLAAKPDAITISVDPKSVISTQFRGVGIQVDPFHYEPTPEKWKMIWKRVDACQPGFFRMCFQNDSYCDRLDANGEPVFRWTVQPNHPKLKQVYEILDYAQAHGVKVLLGEWGTPGFWNTGKRVSPEPGSALWSKLVVGILTHLVKDKGYTCITEFDYFNEPNGDWSGNPSYETWLKGIKAVGPALAASPVGDKVKLSGPSASGDSGWQDALKWLDRAAKDAPEQFGSYNLHWYAKDKEVIGGLIEPNLIERKLAAQTLDPSAKEKQFFVAESGLLDGKVNGDQQPRVKTYGYGLLMADYFAQVCRAGWSGATFWDLDDAMHPVTADTPNPPGPLTLKVWGFWNSQGDVMVPPESTAPREPFYVWTLLSRLFPPGCSIVKSQAHGDSDLRTTASTSNGELSLLVVNESYNPKTVRIPLSAVHGRSLLEYHYFPGDHPQNADGVPIPVRRRISMNRRDYVVEFPGRGCVFLTSAKQFAKGPAR